MGWIISLAFLIVAGINRDLLDPNMFLIAAGLFAIASGVAYIGTQIGKIDKSR